MIMTKMTICSFLAGCLYGKNIPIDGLALSLYKICSISPNKAHVIKTCLTLCQFKFVHKHSHNRLARLAVLDLGKGVIALDRVNTK